MDIGPSTGLFLGICKMKKLPKCCFRMWLTVHLCILLMLVCLSAAFWCVLLRVCAVSLFLNPYGVWKKNLRWRYLPVRCSGVCQGSGASSWVPGLCLHCSLSLTVLGEKVDGFVILWTNLIPFPTYVLEWFSPVLIPYVFCNLLPVARNHKNSDSNPAKL